MRDNHDNGVPPIDMLYIDEATMRVLDQMDAHSRGMAIVNAFFDSDPDPLLDIEEEIAVACERLLGIVLVIR